MPIRGLKVLRGYSRPSLGCTNHETSDYRDGPCGRSEFSEGAEYGLHFERAAQTESTRWLFLYPSDQR